MVIFDIHTGWPAFKQRNCHYILQRLGSVATWDSNPTIRMRGKRSNRLHHQRGSTKRCEKIQQQQQQEGGNIEMSLCKRDFQKLKFDSIPPLNSHMTMILMRPKIDLETLYSINTFYTWFNLYVRWYGMVRKGYIRVLSHKKGFLWYGIAFGRYAMLYFVNDKLEVTDKCCIE